MSPCSLPTTITITPRAERGLSSLQALLISRVFANVLEDRSSIPGRFILKTQKMVLDAALLSTQHYKVRIKGKVEQFREWSSVPPTLRCSSY